jgi:hypothetical protein
MAVRTVMKARPVRTVLTVKVISENRDITRVT